MATLQHRVRRRSIVGSCALHVARQDPRWAPVEAVALKALVPAPGCSVAALVAVATRQQRRRLGGVLFLGRRSSK